MLPVKSLLLTFVLVTLVTFAQSKWVQIWSDEFDGNSINLNNWHFQEGGKGWGNNELEYYTRNRTENARVEKGHLVIHARVENMGGRQFTSARLMGKHAFTYGKMEAKAWLPVGKHLWPSVWMMPHDDKYGAWAASGEIDIMECRGEMPHVNLGTIHYGGSIPNNTHSGSGEKTFSQDFSKGWHTFGIEWSPTDIKWFVDGQHYHTENINRMMWSGKGKNPYNKNGQPFDQAFHFILNIAVGGNFFPEHRFGKQVTPDEAKHWAKPTMEIDYVRVFRWEN